MVLAPQSPHTSGQMAVRDRFADIKARVATESPMTIDAGASTGRTIAILLSYFAHPTIHAFEPHPESAAELRRKYASEAAVFVHEIALGSSSNRLYLNMLRRHSSSSLLEPSAANRHYHGREMDLVGKHPVRQERLDALFDEAIDLLKLDLQGYELEALKGCELLLPRIRCITLEIEFVPLYEKQPLFAEVDLFLRSQGFRLLNLYELWTHPDGQLTAGDAVYLNARFFGEQEPEQELMSIE